MRTSCTQNVCITVCSDLPSPQQHSIYKLKSRICTVVLILHVHKQTLHKCVHAQACDNDDDDDDNSCDGDNSDGDDDDDDDDDLQQLAYVITNNCKPKHVYSF